VVVIGAGVAGLTAAAAAARAGARVVVLESGVAGGRARTEVREGFRFNRGPHALYRVGPGRGVLSRLGVKPTGHTPPLLHSQAFITGRACRFPAGKAARVAARVAAVAPSRWAGASAAEWIGSLRLPADTVPFAEAGVRLATYVADLGRLPADVAIGQVRALAKGVTYLDGGWQQLSTLLLTQAVAAGALVRTHTRAEHITGIRGAWEVHTTAETLPAAAVVLAPGRPAAARRLLPAEPDWGDLGPEVTAACLDLGLRRHGARFMLGIDQPLYLSPHAPPGDLAPPGCELVHVMRYGATTAAEDRNQLRALAATAGITPSHVVAERFLPRMVVASCLPTPRRGLAGRPSVAVPGTPGLFLAGDWVGPHGWLAHASLASGEHAGLLAAQTAHINTRICLRPAVP
jgi:phytoene dehydrogenase-like protein